MKITETITIDSEYTNTISVAIKIETETKTQRMFFREGEPEDMTFGRDLSDVFSITEMLKLAYEAGKRGEELNMEFIEEEE